MCSNGEIILTRVCGHFSEVRRGCRGWLAGLALKTMMFSLSGATRSVLSVGTPVN